MSIKIMYTGGRTSNDAFHFRFLRGWYLGPYTFFHVYLRRIDRRKWKCRIGNVFRLVDGTANEQNWKNVTERYEDNNDEVHAAMLSLRWRIFSCFLGNVY